MFNKYGNINFPILFPVLLMSDSDYIELTGLMNVKDLSNDKYVSYVKITMVMNPSSMTIKIDYEDNTTVTINTTMLDFTTDFSTHFGNSIESVGGIHTNSTVTTILTNVDNACTLITDKNYMFLFQLKSPHNHVNKDLIHVGEVEVNYTRPITHKRIVLDMKRTLSDVPFNYVLLTVLNRYYYVTDATMTNEHSVLDLVEDVLMSFNFLIKQQTAFVERNEFTYDSDKVDDLVTYDYDKNVTYTTITPTNDIYFTSSSLSNVGFWVLLGV